MKKPLALLSCWAAIFFLPAISFAASTLQYSWNMDTNPGWTTEGLWAWGIPQGLGGGIGEGGPDPTSGHTGSYVYGYNLSGNYEPNLSEKHLTTQAIDCTGLTQVELKFWRWLGVERYEEVAPGFYFGDVAAVSISVDGIHWEVVAQNEEYNIEDTSWHPHEWDISNFADGQATVYLRWTMGPTDNSYNYCGWNIDDVEIWAVSSASCPDCSGPIVENVTFPANKNCECISSTSIIMGTGITFETGANVTVKAPTVILKPGFRAPSNARLNIRQP